MFDPGNIFALARIRNMSLLLFLVLLKWRQVLSLPLNSPLLDSYDYVIAGGGPAGLTVAMRLSEDPNVNVLLLEAGPADRGEPEVTIPGLIGEDIGGTYDWNLSTVPQTFLDGQSRSFPQGRVLGGSTILNGMLWNRGGQADYQDWVELGNPGWSWNDMLPYFIKSETYTPVYSPDIAAQFSIEEDPSVHGLKGPVNVSFPKYFWNSSAVLFDALNELGVPTSYDPNTGSVAGASFLPLGLDPDSEQRADARRAYYGPYASRANLWVITGQTVTQILFADRSANADASIATSDGSLTGSGRSSGMPFGIFGGTTSVHVLDTLNPGLGLSPWKRSIFRWLRQRVDDVLLRRQSLPPPSLPAPGPVPNSLLATGVEYAADAQSPRATISATREVIVSAGALHSPQLLMLSGIGPASALQALQIPTNLDLPGVGQNLQDHGQVWVWYPYFNASYPNPTELTDNATFASEAWGEYWANRSGPFTSPAIDGVAFPALPYIVNGSTDIADAAAAQSPAQFLVNGVESSVLNGYAAQKTLLTAALRDISRAAYELINANDGVLTVATMRPFSRGTLTLSSPQPFDPPAIDPRYASNPTDTQVLQAAIAFNQRLCYTESLSQLDPVQVYPPANASSDDILQYIRSKWQTEYHPGGTCAMLPLNLGGVVDPNLLVYGTQNLRVVDSSVFPMLPAAHLQAVVYGVAEKAADMIKAANSNTTSIASSSAPFPTLLSTTLSSSTSSASPSINILATQQNSPVLSSAAAASSGATTSLNSLASSTINMPPVPVVTMAATLTVTTFETVVYTQTVYDR